VADVAEEETLVDGDVGDVLVGGGVGGALVRVPLPTNMGTTVLLLVVPLLLLLPSLVVAPVTITRNRTFCYKVTGLTTLVANLLGTGLVVSPLPLFEDLTEALDDEHHLLIIDLGGVDGKPTL
jgi:4-amino-4-deoxy-L-arabinose transferase-like glycosyltransferase